MVYVRMYSQSMNNLKTKNPQPSAEGAKNMMSQIKQLPESIRKYLPDESYDQPEEELALSHGDFCLPNILIDGSTIQYIDLGRTGIADKWFDIALCYRSLSHNYDGAYGGKSYSGLDDLLLFRKLGLDPDWKKIRYYILLDELF